MSTPKTINDNNNHTSDKSKSLATKASRIKQTPVDILITIKSQIEKTLEESTNQLTLLTSTSSQINPEYEKSLKIAQDEYTKSINTIYSHYLIKREEVNEKYNYDLFKVKELYEAKDNITNINNKIYESVLADKNAEIKAIEDTLKEQLAYIRKDYNDKRNMITQSRNTQLNNINFKEAFNDLRKKIDKEIEIKEITKLSTVTKVDKGDKLKK